MYSRMFSFHFSYDVSLFSKGNRFLCEFVFGSQPPYFDGRTDFFFVSANKKEVEKLTEILMLKIRGE